MTQEPLYPEGHPKRIEQDSQKLMLMHLVLLRRRKRKMIGLCMLLVNLLLNHLRIQIIFLFLMLKLKLVMNLKLVIMLIIIFMMMLNMNIIINIITRFMFITRLCFSIRNRNIIRILRCVYNRFTTSMQSPISFLFLFITRTRCISINSMRILLNSLRMADTSPTYL